MRLFLCLSLLLVMACESSFHFHSSAVDASSGVKNDAGATDSSDLSPALCGQAASCPCVANACSCSSLQSCEFAGTGCDDSSGSCSLTCGSRNTCRGQCKSGCQLKCEDGSRCELTMGASAKASCEGSDVTCVLTVGAGAVVQCEAANCTVTCTGACQVLCTSDDGAQPICRFRCAGETAFRSGGGACTN